MSPHAPQTSALAAPFRRHLDHLAVERGLAENTLAAYRRDLARYRRWLEAAGVKVGKTPSETAQLMREIFETK